MPPPPPHPPPGTQFPVPDGVADEAAAQFFVNPVAVYGMLHVLQVRLSFFTVFLLHMACAKTWPYGVRHVAKRHRRTSCRVAHSRGTAPFIVLLRCVGLSLCGTQPQCMACCTCCKSEPTFLQNGFAALGDLCLGTGVVWRSTAECAGVGEASGVMHDAVHKVAAAIPLCTATAAHTPLLTHTPATHPAFCWAPQCTAHTLPTPSFQLVFKLTRAAPS